MHILEACRFFERGYNSLQYMHALEEFNNQRPSRQLYPHTRQHPTICSRSLNSQRNGSIANCMLDLTDKLDEIEIAKEFISVNSDFFLVCFHSNPLLRMYNCS